MTYQKKLEAMTDDELSVLFAKIQYPDKYICVPNENGGSIPVMSDSFQTKCERVVNYCSNYNDIMPIAFGEGIDFILNMETSEYKCLVFTFDNNGEFKDDFEATHKNPLRAAVIVLLLIHKSEQ